MRSGTEAHIADPLNDVVSRTRRRDVIGRINHLKQRPAEGFVPVENAVTHGLSIAVRDRGRQGEDNRLMTVELHCVENRSTRSSSRIRFVKTEVVEVLDLKGLEIRNWPIRAKIVMHQYEVHIRIEAHLVEDEHGPALGDAQYLPL